MSNEPSLESEVVNVVYIVIQINWPEPHSIWSVMNALFINCNSLSVSDFNLKLIVESFRAHVCEIWIDIDGTLAVKCRLDSFLRKAEPLALLITAAWARNLIVYPDAQIRSKVNEAFDKSFLQCKTT